MADSKIPIIKLIIGIMIFALLFSLKNIVFINLENLGFTYFEANDLRQAWEDWKGDYIYILVSLLISLVIALKFNIKGD